MASNKAAALPLPERSDVHKASILIETLVNAFNDYTEAVMAIASFQKKLSKALKDVAASKLTDTVSANAFSAAATIFETLSEIDNKFAKLTDKECETISNDVRKWFKKLSKEERTHDGRIGTLDARVKKANQEYETKIKKNPRDTIQEHTRYINLIGSLGPEIAQEKYNHALLVSTRHSATTANVAASLSRLADAEWLRSCEEVRRFAPVIGTLGQWRALCEGGWTGPQPKDLPFEADEMSGPRSMASTPTVLNTPVEESPKQSKGILAKLANDDDEELAPPRPPFAPTTKNDTLKSIASEKNNMDSVGSIASLTSFPAPPTHFPIPEQFTEEQRQRARTLSDAQKQQLLKLQARMQMQQEGREMPEERSPTPRGPNPEPPLTPRQEFPPDHPQTPSAHTQVDGPNSPSVFQEAKDNIGIPSISDQRDPDDARPIARALEAIPTGNTTYGDTLPRSALDKRSPLRNNLSTYHPSSSPVIESPRPEKDDVYSPRTDDFDEREFGAIPPDASIRSPTLDAIKSVERNDTGSSGGSSGGSGSIVAAMRNRYSGGASTSSPPPREAPRLPLSVSSLASKYQAASSPSQERQPQRAISPPIDRRRTTSPPTERQRVLSNTRSGIDAQAPSSYRDSTPSPRNGGDRPPSRESLYNPARNLARLSASTSSREDEDEASRRRKLRLEELAQLELKEKEYELRIKERDVEERARALQREREQLQSAKSTLVAERSSLDVPRTAVAGHEGAHRKSLDTYVERPTASGSASLSPTTYKRERRTSLKVLDHAASTSQLGQRRYAASSTQLVPPPSPSNTSASRSRSPTTSTSSSATNGMRPSLSTSSVAAASSSNTNNDHAPSCGCESCSASKYREFASSSTPSSPYDLRPPSQPIVLRPEKPKGWMRRLSMPVVTNAFSSSSSSDSGTKRGFGLTRSSSREISIEDTRLKSLGAGISNRSLTNVGKR